MEIKAIKTSLFKKSDSLIDFVLNYTPYFKEGEILVITSKIVALAEGRVGKVYDRKKLIVHESQKVIETPWADLTLMKDGWCLNAGIDESNADGGLILLPKDPFATALSLQKSLAKKFSLKHFGVLITDTKSMPLRKGTIGRALGFAGFKPLRDYRGKKDLFDRKSRFTESNIADALAAGAVAVMGEGQEQTPLALIKNAPIEWSQNPLSAQEKNLGFSPEKDIFAAVFKFSGR